MVTKTSKLAACKTLVNRAKRHRRARASLAGARATRLSLITTYHRNCRKLSPTSAAGGFSQLSLFLPIHRRDERRISHDIDGAPRRLDLPPRAPNRGRGRPRPRRRVVDVAVDAVFTIRLQSHYRASISQLFPLRRHHVPALRLALLHGQIKEPCIDTNRRRDLQPRPLQEHVLERHALGNQQAHECRVRLPPRDDRRLQMDAQSRPRRAPRKSEVLLPQISDDRRRPGRWAN